MKDHQRTRDFINYLKSLNYDEIYPKTVIFAGTTAVIGTPPVVAQYVVSADRELFIYEISGSIQQDPNPLALEADIESLVFFDLTLNNDRKIFSAITAFTDIIGTRYNSKTAYGFKTPYHCIQENSIKCDFTVSAAFPALKRIALTLNCIEVKSPKSGQ